MRPEHLAANQMLQCYVDEDKEGMISIYNSLENGLKEVVAPLVKRQRLMFNHDDYRYLCWCTVRPNNGK